MTIEDRVQDIRTIIESLCRREVRLIAVCKGVPTEDILEAGAAGVKDFGDNYLQESLSRRASLSMPGRWHFMGRMQSNKVARIARSFDVIHTLDSVETARRLCKSLSEPIECFLQVNIAHEPSKAGVLPQDVASTAETLYDMPKIRLVGLMTIGPENQNAEQARPYFYRMRKLLEGLQSNGATRLSMGMSNDFQVAIQEGATDVRIGTGIFGPRNYR
jgi:pyridoxal phosphate enzyme (YggS family)